LEGRTEPMFLFDCAFHEALGFRLESMELSSELSVRLLPDLDAGAAPLFREDGLVHLRVAKS
jgi:hypothetical protein